MELFNPNAKVDFMGLRRWSACFSILIALFSLGSLTMKGLNWGLDFTGGVQMVLNIDQATSNLETIRERLSDQGFADAQVMSYGSSRTVLISLKPQAHASQQALVDRILKLLPGAQAERVDIVGPQVGQELATKGALAVLVSLLALLVYIALRFEYKLSISAVVALIHDPVLILGVFAFWGIEFDLKALAGLMAVIGYSLNDTIVVFDRVRENFMKLRRLNPLEIMNLSINQTLSRTIMTSVLTLFVVVALLVYGGEAIHGFALALVIGIVVGTYSSIYVAGSLAVSLGLNRQDFVKNTQKVLNDRP